MRKYCTCCKTELKEYVTRHGEDGYTDGPLWCPNSVCRVYGVLVVVYLYKRFDRIDEWEEGEL